MRLLAAVTPEGAAEERARLVAELTAGRPATPRWRYAPVDYGHATGLLRAADHELRAWPPSPLRDVYAARLEEVAREASLAASVGAPRFGALARERFGPARADDARCADALAAAWRAASADDEDDDARASRTSDGVEPTSLVARLRAEVGRLRLPFRVQVEPSLGSLAATGERTIFVARGRALTEADVARTVLHEVHGHAAPRARAARQVEPIFALGTARGADEQEGYALLLEDRAGFLGARRRRELAARHAACAWMADGASFADVAARLVRDVDASPEAAVRVAERAFRGGDGVAAGLGRERVYLEAFVRVRDHLAAAPDDEVVLAAGQIAVPAIDAVRGRLT